LIMVVLSSLSSGISNGYKGKVILHVNPPKY
jgi:hypothetical protein